MAIEFQESVAEVVPGFDCAGIEFQRRLVQRYGFGDAAQRALGVAGIDIRADIAGLKRERRL